MNNAVEDSSVTPYPSGTAPFETLPPEVAEIIFKMAMSNEVPWRHNFLVDVIAKVSTRFKYLAALKSLWQGEVDIRGDSEYVKQVTQKFLNKGISHLTFEGTYIETPTFTDDLLVVAAKCENLKKLKLCTLIVMSWPTFTVPWVSLKELYLQLVTMNANTFLDVRLHQSLPNLEKFCILNCHSIPESGQTWGIILPDMVGCHFLRRVVLTGSVFQMDGLPPTLSTLGGSKSLINNIDIDSLEEYFDNCVISDDIKFPVNTAGQKLAVLLRIECWRKKHGLQILPP